MFGWAHRVFLWWEDILHDYALLGFVLLLTPRLPSGFMLTLAAALLCLSGLLGALVAFATGHSFEADITRAHAEMNSALWRGLSTGDYGATIQASLLRVRLLYSGAGAMTLLAPLLGQFLLGAWIFRQGWPQDAASNRILFRRVAAVALPSGLAIASLAPLHRLWPTAMAMPAPLPGILDDIGTVSLALGYGNGIGQRHST